MTPDLSRAPRTRVPPLILLVVITAVLHFGQDFLIPLALAILLTFLLAPAVTRLERWRLGRVPATVVVVVLSFSAIGLVGWTAGNHLVGLANSLPEYRDNIRTKLESLRSSPSGSLGRAAEALRELGEDLGLTQPSKATAPGRPGGRSAPGAATAPRVPGSPASTGAAGAARSASAPGAEPVERQPIPVEVQPNSTRPLQLISEIIAPVLAPLGTAAAVILFTVLMLLKREDLRDRLIRLIGQGEINVTTQALEEAAERVSRFLRMQLVVNVSYGVPVGIALYILGIPNAALWGLLATVLRFVPYVGPWIAAAFPVALAFAIDDGWSLVFWTVGVFAVLELLSNNVVEPWLYGASTGLSAFAIIVSALFWTWLWGAVGLLLATPLTVCVAVLGRYIPQLAFLDVMLGDEPVLAPQARFYQRLLARDEEEATEIAESYLREHSLVALYDEVIIPALGLAEHDRHRDALDEKRERYFFDATRRIVELIAERPVPAEQDRDAAADSQADSRQMGSDARGSGRSGSGSGSGSESSGPERGRHAVAAAAAAADQARPGVFVLSARDEADHIAGMMLADLLAPQAYAVQQMPLQILVGEVLDRVAEEKPAVACISAVPPLAVMHAGYLCKRLRARFPTLKILVAVWNPEGDIDKARARLQAAGMDRLVTTLRQADEQVRELALPAAMALQASAVAADTAELRSSPVV